MGHDSRSTVARFLVAEGLTAGATIALDDDAVHHLRVLRVAAGSTVGLTDGAGSVATGTLTSVSRSRASVEIRDVARVATALPVRMLVPVADRDRMLWLAEKCTELGATTWQPVFWHRSGSVSPRGDSPAFQARVRARMASALTQSGGAWLPAIAEATPLVDAIAASPPGTRIVLDPAGPPLLEIASSGLRPPVSVAVGPEGGIEEAELASLMDAGFVRASLGDTILRFETAGVAALAILRAALLERGERRLSVSSSERADGQ